MFLVHIPASQSLAQARTYSSDTFQQFLESDGRIALFVFVVSAFVFLLGRS